MSNVGVYPVSIYGNGLFQDGYPTPPVPYTTQAQQLNQGITTVLLWSIHIHASGDLYLNDTPFVANGQISYSTDSTQGVNPDFPSLIKALLNGTGSVKELLVSVGAWGTTSDFRAWYAARPAVLKNLKALQAAFNISGVDFDFEPENGYTDADADMIVALTMDVASLGLFATYCPYTNASWWADCLAEVYQQGEGKQHVRWFNLQCYAGGTGNSPSDWAEAIQAAGNTGINDPMAFVVPGFAVAGSESDGQTPGQLQGTFSDFAGSGTNGGFLWNSGAIWQGEGANPQYTPQAYAKAIVDGLRS